jgi:hypothetical protein
VGASLKERQQGPWGWGLRLLLLGTRPGLLLGPHWMGVGGCVAAMSMCCWWATPPAESRKCCALCRTPHHTASPQLDAAPPVWVLQPPSRQTRSCAARMFLPVAAWAERWLSTMALTCGR